MGHKMKTMREICTEAIETPKLVSFDVRGAGGLMVVSIKTDNQVLLTRYRMMGVYQWQAYHPQNMSLADRRAYISDLYAQGVKRPDIVALLGVTSAAVAAAIQPVK